MTIVPVDFLREKREEKAMFTVNRVLPGIFHIQDAMGVSFTLMEGKDRALLFDAPVGIKNIANDKIQSVLETCSPSQASQR